MIRKQVKLTENILAGQSNTSPYYVVLVLDDNVYDVLRDNEIFLFLFKEFELIPFRKGFEFVYLEDVKNGYIDIEKIIVDPDGDFSKEEMEILLGFLVEKGELEGLYELVDAEIVDDEDY